MKFRPFIPSVIIFSIINVLSFLPNDTMGKIDLDNIIVDMSFIIDKIEHAAAYFIFTLFLFLALSAQPKNRISSISLLISILFSVVWGGLVELLQPVIPGINRTSNILDFYANTIGSLAVLIFWFYKVFNKRRLQS